MTPSPTVDITPEGGEDGAFVLKGGQTDPFWAKDFFGLPYGTFPLTASGSDLVSLHSISFSRRLSLLFAEARLCGPQ